MGDRKKKIVFLTDPREWGGCEILLLDYLTAIDYSKVEVVLMTTNDFFSKRIAERGLPVKVELFPFKLAGHPLSRFIKFYRMLSKFKPMDKIIYFTGGFYIFKWSEYLAGYMLSKKEVYSVENLGPFKLPETGDKKYFGVIPPLNLWRHKKIFFAKLRLSLCKRILTVGLDIKTRLVDWYGCSPNKIFVAYNGVSSKKFSPDRSKKENFLKRYHRTTGDIVITSTSRLSQEKCVYRLLEAIAQIKDKYHNIFVVIVGDGPLRSELEKLAVEKGLMPIIKFVGYQENVVDFLHLGDIFVLPSDYEGFSIAMLEAMAVGLIPVRTDTCGAGEVIIHGENGFIVECSTEGVRKGLEMTLKLTAAQRRIMSEKARKTIEENFDFTKNIKRAVSFLELSPVSDFDSSKG